jgi:hypothetical protein
MPPAVAANGAKVVVNGRNQIKLDRRALGCASSLANWRQALDLSNV